MVSDDSLKERGGAQTHSPPPPSQGSLQRVREAPPTMHFLSSNFQTSHLLAEEASLEKRGGMKSPSSPLG